MQGKPGSVQSKAQHELTKECPGAETVRTLQHSHLCLRLFNNFENVLIMESHQE